MKIIDVHNVSFFRFLPIKKIRDVLCNTLKGENIETADITLVLTDEASIRKLNKEYLNHDYVTDVIAFPFDEDELAGEIYVCVEQAKRQAQEYNVSLRNELLRLAVHGLLHLIGYDDKTDDLRKKMFEKQEKYILSV